MNSLSKLVVVLGPTATGKSDLAVLLAKKFGGEVISADSRQVYKGLDIGAGKITKREMRGVTHHMLDVASPKRQFSVAQFKQKGEKVIRDMVRRGKLPIICGGAGFYIQALTDGIILPEVKPDQKLRKILGRKTVRELFALLKKLDPVRAQSIEKSNPRRLIRAIEIARSLGKSPPLGVRRPTEYDVLFVGLDMPDEKLKERIAVRAHKRMHAGMVAEAKRLHLQGLSYRRMEELGLEYRYLAQYLKGELTKEDLEREIKKGNWRYAKRQRMWFKRDERIKWFTPNQNKKIGQEVARFLGS